MSSHMTTKNLLVMVSCNAISNPSVSAHQIMRHDILNSAAILHIRSIQKARACSSGTVRMLPS
jgi:hypothetical protein